jgi:hypothetical protein
MRKIAWLFVPGVMLGMAACGDDVTVGNLAPDGGMKVDAALDGAQGDVAKVDAGPEAESGEDGGPTTLPTLDTPCPSAGGLTGQDILNAVRSEYMGIFTPASTSQDVPLTIQTTYTGAPAVCHPSNCDECPPGWVQLDVQIHFSTADGLFDETFTTPIELSAGSTELKWDAYVPAMDIKGTYKPTLTGKTVNLSFGGDFMGPSTSGLVEQQAMNGGSGKVAPAGTWN